MLDFANFTTQDWIAIGSLAVSTLMLISNVVIVVWAVTTEETKMKYDPGAALENIVRGSSPVGRRLLEIGAFDGDYEVTAELGLAHPEIVEIWQAARAKWSQQVFSFDDIADWTHADGPEVLSNEFFTEISDGKADMLAAALVCHGVFNAISGGMSL